MVVSFDTQLPLVSPTAPFEVFTELQPGGASAVHFHPLQEETYKVLKGSMELFMHGKWKTIGPGTMVVIPKGTVHAFRNKSGTTAKAINIHDPGLRFGEMLVTIQQFIDVGKITGTSGFRNLAHMSAIMLRYQDVMQPVKPPLVLLRMMAGLGRIFGFK